MSFLQFEPIYQERVWGGNALAEHFGRQLPKGKPIGESWEIVDRADVQSIVRDGPDAGATLRELIEARAEEIMGPGWERPRAFPLLVKWLDCRERLSLQVHPPARIAAMLGGEPKTENWYIAHAAAGAGVLAGLKPGVDADCFRAALENNTAESLVERHATAPGDSVLIESGVMHAIDGGNLILEIQQNSDTTYRVYDWGRVGLDGQPRELHIEKSLACLKDNRVPAPRVRRAAEPDEMLADCAEFRLRRVRLTRGTQLHFAAEEQVRIISVVEGALSVGNGGTAERGANLLLPFADNFAFTATADTTVLVTENFTRI